MMRKLKIWMKIQSSIQYRLFASFVLAVIIPVLTIGITTYLVSIRLISDKVSASFEQTVNFMRKDVEKNIQQIEQISDYIFSNPSIKQAIETQGKSAYQRTKDVEALEQVFSNASVANIFRSIKTIRIYDLDKLRFSYSLDPTYQVFEDGKIQNSPYFSKALTNKGELVWADLTEKFEYDSKLTDDSISIFRVIKNQNYSKVIGVLYICLKQSYFTDQISSQNADQIGMINILDKSGQKFTILNQSKAIIEQTDRISETTAHSDIIITQFIPRTSWTIQGRISKAALLQDTPILLIVVLLSIGIGILFASGLWFLVSRSVLLPVKELTRSCQQIITSGNLTNKVEVYGNDEIGQLSRNFNYMIDRINHLFGEIIVKQQKIQAAEIRSLQAQINPHFLYNTLNTIRWMAILKRTDHIAGVVESLARLLRCSTAKTAMFITVEEETSILMDYINLQKQAYQDKFDVLFNIDDDVKDSFCLKFILQPLVENSIFHGIEPKTGFGLISIRIYASEGKLFFVVHDNGIGIDNTKIETLLDNSPETATNSSNSIGLSNVNQRIQNIYGPDYGLSIKSSTGEFTEVTIVIPNRKSEKGEI